MSERPGGHLKRRRDSLAIVIFAGVGVALLLGAMGLAYRPLAAAAFPLLAYLWWQSKDRRWLDPDSWIKGLRGERAVGRALEKLPPTFRVLHDLDTGHGNVDHVVVGPTGLFAIETKEWEGRFTERGGRLFHNGREDTRTRTQAIRGAMDVRRRLAAAGLNNLWVEAIIVSSRTLVGNGKLDLPQARVLDVTGLVPYIEGARQGLSAETIARAAEAVTSPAPARLL